MATVKVEEESMGLKACRVCLALDMKLYHIRESGLDQQFTEIMGTSYSTSDGLPQHICSWCRTLLVKAHQLRTRCGLADTRLRGVLADHPITNLYITTIDRFTHNLRYTLTQNLKTEIHYYYQEGTTATSDNTCANIVKSEIDSNLYENEVYDEVKSNILQVDIIEGEAVFNRTRDEVNNSDSDEDSKMNLQAYKYKIEVEVPETASLKQVKTSKTRPKKDNKRVDAKTKVKVKKENVRRRVRKVKEEKDFEPRYFTVDEIAEFIKKYNFEIQHLSDQEMAEDMERRKVSDRYKHCKFKCTLCYKGFLTTTTFDNHMEKDHNPLNAKYECHLCHWRYRYGFHLKQHIQNCHRLRLRCRECGEGVYGRTECVAHKARHAGTTRQCKYCGKHYLKRSSFMWHMRAAHPLENAASGTCEVCGEIFTSAKGLAQHKYLTHNKKSTATSEFQCARCRFAFDNEDALRTHQQQQVDNKCDPTLSACAACGAGCAGAEALLRHKRAAHRVEIFTCDACNKSFLSKSSLSTHIDRVHLGIKAVQHHVNKKRDHKKYYKKPLPQGKRSNDHMCETCGKAYTSRQFLRNHQMTHTGERPFKCDRCPKGFTTAVQLTWHTRTHTGERPFQCDQCHQRFSFEGNLRRHRRTVHLGISKNVPCTRCEKTFCSNTSMKLHVKTVHDGVPWPRRERRRRPHTNTDTQTHTYTHTYTRTRENSP